jgi:hypothetical protein
MPPWDGRRLLYSSVVSLGISLPPFNNLFWIPAGSLLVLSLLFMTGDIVTKFLSCEPEGRRIFQWEHEFVGKLLLVSLIVMSFLLDAVVYFLANFFPHNFPFLNKGYLFITIATEVWLIMGEVVKITTNIKTRAGAESIPPPVEAFVRMMRWALSGVRKVDERRQSLWVTSRDGTATVVPKRWYDDMTEEDVHAFMDFMEARRKNPEPPPPHFHGDPPG